MGAKSGFALRLLQWLVRAVQLLCAALILGVYSYFLAVLASHGLPVATAVRAVEGIAGAAVLYALAALLLLCCLAGLAPAAAAAVLLDLAFVGALIYVAVANRRGAGSCDGYLDTPFGAGRAADTAADGAGFARLPSFRTACRLQTACLAAAIIAIGFFCISILLEVALARHHRKEKRFGPGPANNYTSGYGSSSPSRPGLLGRLFGRRRRAAAADDENGLPEHTLPSQLDPDARESYGTETTAVPHEPAGPYQPYSPAKHDAGYGYHRPRPAPGWHAAATPQAPYGDGVYDRP